MRRASPTVWQHCAVNGASGARRHPNPAVPKRARALATVAAAAADFIPTGRRAPSDPQPAQLRDRVRAVHTFDDAPLLTTPTTHSAGLLPRVKGGAFPVRCAERRILLVFCARQ